MDFKSIQVQFELLIHSISDKPCDYHHTNKVLNNIVGGENEYTGMLTQNQEYHGTKRLQCADGEQTHALFHIHTHTKTIGGIHSHDISAYNLPKTISEMPS